jgi:magnesium transporter
MRANLLARPPRRLNRLVRQAGTSPGTLSVEAGAAKPSVLLIAYGPDKLAEIPDADLETIRGHLGQWPVVWVHVAGLGDVELLRRLGDLFGLHPLALEDVATGPQRPKVEHFDNLVFVIARMLVESRAPRAEQLSLFFGRDFILSFEEIPGDPFEPVRERLRQGHGRLRRSGPDYLAYALLDAVIDQYFVLLDAFDDRIERLDEQIFAGVRRDLGPQIHRLKTELLSCRRAVWPLKDVIYSLWRDETPFVARETQIYLRDCHDHLVHILDLLESYREIAGGLMDVQLAAINNRLNEIMKVLTMIATLFIPLSFIASLYGMNFSPDASPLNMPELRWRFGYPFALSLMTASAAGLLYLFKRKGWLWAPKEEKEEAQRKP